MRAGFAAAVQPNAGFAGGYGMWACLKCCRILGLLRRPAGASSLATGGGFLREIRTSRFDDCQGEVLVSSEVWPMPPLENNSSVHRRLKNVR